MKRYKEYRDEELIERTREHLHSFYDRNMDRVYGELDDSFVWIGANEFQWTQGTGQFKEVTHAESMETPVSMGNEEYHVLARDRHLYIVYGRYTAKAMTQDGTALHASVRVTYVWQLIRDTLRIIHIHGSNAQDVPVTVPSFVKEAFSGSTGFFDYMRGIDYQAMGTEKLEFRDRQGNHHFLFPGEVRYLQARRQWCTVHTQNSSFDVRGGISGFEKKMSGSFIRLHKSYLVNIGQIDVIRRYTAVLKDGRELPVSKDRFLAIRDFLRKAGC